MNSAEQIYRGTPAAKGLAIGSLYIYTPRRKALVSSSKGNPASEKKKLEQAIDKAKEGLSSMMAKLEDEAGEIVAFQVEMLADEEFLAPIFAAIAEGKSAASSWQKFLNEEIKHYQQAEDSYLRERYADIKDIYWRVHNHLVAKDGDDLSLNNSILVTNELMPSEFLSLDLSQLKGLAMVKGNPNNHVAILARAHRVPLVVNMRIDATQLPQAKEAILDGEKGELICSPAAMTIARVKKQVSQQAREEELDKAFLPRPALMANGDPVRVLINVNSPADLKGLLPAHCDGIGLARTEFFFSGEEVADEEEQLAAYRQLIDWAGDKPVTIRTMDIGGDKPVAGISAAVEANPFLGLRGVRFSLYHQQLFRTQLRALCRAAAVGRVKIMIPMVTLPAELEQVRKLLKEVIAELKKEKLKCCLPLLGIMVEVPATALCAADFAADFYSIGTNDLIQYTMAAARDSNYSQVNQLADPAHPALLRLIREVVLAGDKKGDKKGAKREVSLCGDMAADERFIPHLVRQGVRNLSVVPTAIGKVKRCLSNIK